uniref:Uncharacterized protein n=1 Tax=Anguilla anguilla TaxID=7936 RepID=A0A0E9WMG3_ANGAN
MCSNYYCVLHFSSIYRMLWKCFFVSGPHFTSTVSHCFGRGTCSVKLSDIVQRLCTRYSHI